MGFWVQYPQWPLVKEQSMKEKTLQITLQITLPSLMIEVCYPVRILLYNDGLN